MFARRTLTIAAALTLALAPAAGARTRTHTHARARAHGVSAASCTGADTSAVGAPAGLMRSAVVCLVNAQRTGHGLAALNASAQLDRSAQGWSNTMVRTNQFTHGADFAARITAAGYSWGDAGENIAAGFETPRQVVAGWMGSLGHCQNILDPSFADVGTGVSPHGLEGVGPATWTQDFGLWLGHRAPSHNEAPAHGCPYRVS